MANRSYAGAKLASPDAVKRLLGRPEKGNQYGQRSFGDPNTGVPQPTPSPQVAQMGKSGTGISGAPNVKSVRQIPGRNLTSPDKNTALKAARKKMVGSARPKNAELKNAAARRLAKIGRSKFSGRM